MPVIAPTPVDALPVAPDPNDRSTFDARAYPYQVALSGRYREQINAIAVNVSANATDAATSATAAASASVSASQAASVAASAANFKGNWSDLTGALIMPACVRHSGRFWVLLANLANVTTAAPGVSASWAALDVGTVPSQLLSTDSATVNAVAGVRYIVAANNVTLVAPTTLLKGDFHGARWMTGASGGVWNFGPTPVRGWVAGTLEIDVERFGLDLYYEDTTRGLI
jgi:hypothetical protein